MSPADTRSKLAQLREMSVVVADTGDFDAVRRLRPVDCTTNPTLVRKALDLPAYAEAIERQLAWAHDQGGNPDGLVEQVVDLLTIEVGAALAELIPGRVSTEVDADLAHDTEATVRKAHRFIELYAQLGLGRDRVLIKVAATWDGVEAARILQRDGIDLHALGSALSTPFYAYSANAIRQRIADLQHELLGMDAVICFAVKANPTLAILQLMAKAGVGADIVSSGELRRSLRAGIPASKIVFSGVGKSDAEIAEALKASGYGCYASGKWHVTTPIRSCFSRRPGLSPKRSSAQSIRRAWMSAMSSLSAGRSMLPPVKPPSS